MIFLEDWGDDRVMVERVVGLRLRICFLWSLCWVLRRVFCRNLFFIEIVNSVVLVGEVLLVLLFFMMV